MSPHLRPVIKQEPITVESAAHHLNQRLKRRIRVSVRMQDHSNDRYMIFVDLSTLNTVDSFINHCSELLGAGERDDQQNAGQSKKKLLVLEPDIIVRDIETLEKNDNLVITTEKNLREMQQQLAQLSQLQTF